jgi:hypothetical protein
VGVLLKEVLGQEHKVQLQKILQKEESKMDTSTMSQDELDLWADINNPNNEADMDDWSDAHNPNNDSFIDED